MGDTSDKSIVYQDQITKVAKALRRAQAIYLLSGAGMSANSGLKTYNDIANVPQYTKNKIEYHDLCDSELETTNPKLFWGFWGQCAESYKEAIPHQGYLILKKWRDEICAKESNQEFKKSILKQYKKLYKLDVDDKIPKAIPTCFFSYTSNVDGLFLKAGFSSSELLEIHGNCLKLQCKNEDCNYIYDYPDDFNIQNNEELLATNVEDLPKCPLCNTIPRPHVMMFDDEDFVPIQEQYDNYDIWEEALEDVLCSKDDYSCVMLEIGCGMKVLSIKYESEAVLGDILTHYIPTEITRSLPQRSPEFLLKKVLLVRINIEKGSYLDYYQEWNDTKVDYDFRLNIIDIVGNAEQVLCDIDNELYILKELDGDTLSEIENKQQE
ncbi:hypothetical protein WA158_000874 [Blastocystis sp. Blastoise]